MRQQRGSCAEYGEDFEGDDGWVGHAPASVGEGIFFPYNMFIRQLKSNENKAAERREGKGDVHSSAKGPTLVLTERPKVER